MILSTLQGLPVTAVLLRPSSINGYFMGKNNQQDSRMIGLPSFSVSKNTGSLNDKTVEVSYTSKLIATVSTLICSNEDDYFEMEKEGKVFFVQRKFIKELPYLLSLVSDEPIPCHTLIGECIGHWIAILLGQSLENILRSAAEKSKLEINSSTFSSSVGTHSHGRHDSYSSSNEEDDDGDGDGHGWTFLRDEDREKFLIFEELFVRQILYNALDISRSIVSHWLYPLSTILSTAEYEYSGSLHSVCTATILSCRSGDGNNSTSNSRKLKHVCSVDLQPTLRSCDSQCCCEEWLEPLQLYANTLTDRTSDEAQLLPLYSNPSHVSSSSAIVAAKFGDGCYVFGLRIPVGFCSTTKCDPNLIVEGFPQKSKADSGVPFGVVHQLPVALQSAVNETMRRISVAFPGRELSRLGRTPSDADNMKAIDDMFHNFPASPSSQNSSSNLLIRPTAEMVETPSPMVISTESTGMVSTANPSSDARVQFLPRPPAPKLEASSSSSSSNGARESGLPTQRHRKLIATTTAAAAAAAVPSSIAHDGSG